MHQKVESALNILYWTNYITKSGNLTMVGKLMQAVHCSCYEEKKPQK